MRRHTLPVAVLMILVLALTLGCSVGRLFVGKPEATPTRMRTVRPTFTPTPEVPPTAIAMVPTVNPVVAEPAPAEQPTALPEPPTPTPSAPTDTPVPPTPTLPPAPFVLVTSDRVNLRNGPGTAYARVGEVSQGQRYDIVAKNPAGDWWQICCVDGQQVWVVGSLVEAQGDLGVVQVASNIAPPPPTATPRPTDTPAPTATPAPQYSFVALGGAEARPSSNPWATVYGKLWTSNQKLAVKGRTVVVARGGIAVAQAVSTFAEGTADGMSWNNPGLPNQFTYNVKVEVQQAPAGVYEVYVLSGDKPASEPIAFTVTSDMREFIVAWKEK